MFYGFGIICCTCKCVVDHNVACTIIAVIIIRAREFCDVYVGDHHKFIEHIRSYLFNREFFRINCAAFCFLSNGRRDDFGKAILLFENAVDEADLIAVHCVECCEIGKVIVVVCKDEISSVGQIQVAATLINGGEGCVDLCVSGGVGNADEVRDVTNGVRGEQLAVNCALFAVQCGDCLDSGDSVDGKRCGVFCR